MKKNKIVIGIDLDGILVDKPPIVPAGIINYLYRDENSKRLYYKIPRSKLQKTIRRLSHVRILRPIISNNISWLRDMYNSHQMVCEIVTGRYSFLDSVTKALLKRNKLDKALDHLWTNHNDEQPHLFKERIIKKNNLKYFVDDDIFMLDYLAEKFPKTNFFWYSKSPYFHEVNSRVLKKNSNISVISSLKELNKLA